MEPEKMKGEYELLKNVRFEIEALEAGAKYLSRSTTWEVVDWLMTHFEEAVSTANRETYVEDFKTQLSFSVCRSLVSCCSSTYEKLCADLPTHMEIAALARALGVNMKVAVLNRYLSHFNDIKITYTDNQGLCPEEFYTTVTVTYQTPNGNVAAAEEW